MFVQLYGEQQLDTVVNTYVTGCLSLSKFYYVPKISQTTIRKVLHRSRKGFRLLEG